MPVKERLQILPPTLDWQSSLHRAAKAHALTPREYVIHATTQAMREGGFITDPTQTTEAVD